MLSQLFTVSGTLSYLIFYEFCIRKVPSSSQKTVSILYNSYILLKPKAIRATHILKLNQF